MQRPLDNPTKLPKKSIKRVKKEKCLGLIAPSRDQGPQRPGKETDIDRSLDMKTKEKSPAKQSAMHICVDADVSVLLQSA